MCKYQSSLLPFCFTFVILLLILVSTMIMINIIIVIAMTIILLARCGSRWIIINIFIILINLRSFQDIDLAQLFDVKIYSLGDNTELTVSVCIY